MTVDLFAARGFGCVWWPWDSLADQFGPMRAGELVTLMASTGAGKTTFVTNLIMGLLPTTPLALISTESTSEELREKMAAAEAGIPERWLAARDMTAASETQRITFMDTHRALRRVPILGLEDFGPKTVGTLQEAIAKTLDWSIEQDRRLRLLVVDHLHELGPRNGEGQLDAWQHAVMMLRDCASAESLAVLLVVQPKRAERTTIPAMYRTPDLHDARGVPQVETASHQVYGLRRCLKLETMGLQERREAVAQIAANQRSIHDFALPRSEIRLLKRRIWGAAVNRTAQLRLEDGKLVDPEPRIPF